MSSLAAGLGACSVFAATESSPAPASLPGFKLEGTKWTYQEGSWSMEGILLKPDGDGPFPALLLGHGRGGNADGFGVSKAKDFVRMGFVCLAPNYTFAGPAWKAHQSGGGAPGASEEDLRRAAKCLDILQSLPYVDAKRLAAYGNDTGALVTIALCAREPARLSAAAITAGGIGTGTGLPVVAVADAARVPLCIIHGGADTIVPVESSLRLKERLDAHHVPNERHVIEGAPHKVHQENAAEVCRLIKDWFVKHGVLK